MSLEQELEKRRNLLSQLEELDSRIELTYGHEIARDAGQIKALKLNAVYKFLVNWASRRGITLFWVNGTDRTPVLVISDSFEQAKEVVMDVPEQEPRRPVVRKFETTPVSIYTPVEPKNDEDDEPERDSDDYNREPEDDDGDF